MLCPISVSRLAVVFRNRALMFTVVQRLVSVGLMVVVAVMVVVLIAMADSLMRPMLVLVRRVYGNFGIFWGPVARTSQLSAPPTTRRVTCSAWCPCLSDADWWLQSKPNARFAASGTRITGSRGSGSGCKTRSRPAPFVRVNRRGLYFILFFALDCPALLCLTQMNRSFSCYRHAGCHVLNFLVCCCLLFFGAGG